MECFMVCLRKFKNSPAALKRVEELNRALNTSGITDREHFQCRVEITRLANSLLNHHRGEYNGKLLFGLTKWTHVKEMVVELDRWVDELNEEAWQQGGVG
jgi:hypothetical protein